MVLRGKERYTDRKTRSTSVCFNAAVQKRVKLSACADFMPVCVVFRKIHRVISCCVLIPTHSLNHFHKPLTRGESLLHCLSCVHLTSSVPVTSSPFLPPDFISFPSPPFPQGSPTDSITVATNCDTSVLTNSASFLSRVCAWLSLHIFCMYTKQLCTCVVVWTSMCACKACELLQAERGRIERLAQIVCEQRSQLDSCPEATKEPLQEQLARVSTHTHTHAHTCTQPGDLQQFFYFFFTYG